MPGTRLGLPLSILVAALCTASAGNVLVVITPGPASHMYGMRAIAQELVARQHNVLLLTADGEAAKLQSTGIPILQYTIINVPGAVSASNFSIQGTASLQSSFAKASRMFEAPCETVVNNATIMTQLQDFQADIMLATSLNLCAQVLASKLDKAFINYIPAGPIDPFFTTIYPNSNRRAFMPNPLSYVPQAGNVTPSQRMTFYQRLCNVGKYLRFITDDFLYLRPFQSKFYTRHGVNLAAPQEMRRLIMHIYSAHFALEWTRPLPPHVKFVGPLLPQPPKPLPAELEAFLDSAGEEGVLYVAMGTLATLGLKERQAMAASFAALFVKVLWRLAPSEVPDEAALAELGLGNNTKVVNWAPQNDVLGHPKVKVFLSHCGANSMYEAAYHGVPIVALPFFADQPANAGKLVAKGMGVRITHKDVFTSAFGEAIRKVLQEPSYRLAAGLISRKLRAHKRTPVQEAADWVEHALETNAEPYLRTPDEELSFIVRHNLDVTASIALAAIGVCFALWRIGRVARRVVLSRRPKAKQS